MNREPAQQSVLFFFIMWIWTTLCSAVLLGFYDLAKKQALKRNGVLPILLWATFFSAVFLLPFLTIGCIHDHLALMLKAVLVTSSWISGLAALKTIPITTASTIKASRPVIVVAMSMILFSEKLNLWQWAGVLTIVASLWMLSRTSRKEGIGFTQDKGIILMLISVLTGAASALYDKHIMSGMEPLFVQSWSNIYITVTLALCILFQRITSKEKTRPFKWDWTIILIAVLITAADALYFFSLKQDGALLSVISLVRRSSVLITFSFGALLFKENNIRDKTIDLAVLTAGLMFLFIGT